MTVLQAKQVNLAILEGIDPVMFSEQFLAMTAQSYSIGDIVVYDGEKFEVVETHPSTMTVETRRVVK
jgi:hypothetical protein